MATQTPSRNSIPPVLWSIFIYAFGLFNWCLYLGLALRRGTFFQKPTEQDQLRLAISRDRFWNLSKSPSPGFHHAFFKLRNGLKLHYITNRRSSRAQVQVKDGVDNLFIFLHGFPDSSMMWRHLLGEPTIPTGAELVCLDLPNFGGSDTFDVPDTAVLEAITEFILAIRERHEEALPGNDKDFSTIIVAHDWGCAIGFRLAAEAPQLADRFILSNGPHVSLSIANADRVIASSSKIFKQFREDPKRNFGCLKKSFVAIRPLLNQVFLFGYIFAFHLPKILVKYLGTGGHFSFLRGIGRAAYGRHKAEYNVQDSLAATLGPGLLEVETKTNQGDTYGQSVHARAASAGEAWWHQTAYYRNGLATRKWEKSLETIAELFNVENESSPIRRRSSLGSTPLFGEQYPGALKAPATILWGENDLAVGKAICLDGISDYLAAGSEVILLPKTGHWATVEKESRVALARLVELFATKSDLPVYVTKEVEGVYEGVKCNVRK